MKGIKNLTVRALCEGAIMLAMALILSLINLVPSAWNFGGSVTLEMLPIIVFCIRWGFGPGMIVSFAYSVLTMLIGNGIACVVVGHWCREVDNDKLKVMMHSKKKYHENEDAS